MKKFATALAALFLTAGFSAYAQQTAPSMLQKASVFYDLNTLYPKDAENAYYNGFGVGYSIDFRVSNSLPLYVGTGLDARFVFRSENILDAENYNPVDLNVKTRFINLNLPVNVSYRVPVADGFFLTPQLGLDLRVQLDGHAKVNSTVNVNDFGGFNTSSISSETDYDLFSKSELGDEHLKRFQFGWHAALNFEYNRFNLGLSYGTDFVKLHKNLGASHFLVSLGYVF